MTGKKSLVEEAIVQMKNLEDVIAENAKGILHSTMKGEISELVKESLTEQEEDEIETEFDIMNLGSEDEESDESEDMMGDDNMEIDIEDELPLDLGDEDDMDFDDEEEVIDLTGEEDEEEILRVFSLMGPEDSITVTKDDKGNINLKDDETDKEYMIVQEGDDEEFSEMDMDDEYSEMEMDEEYDEESIEDIVSKVFDESYNEEELEEGDYYEEEEELEDDSEEIMYELELDEEEEEFEEIDIDEMDDDFMNESSMTVKPKGVGIGKVKPSEVKSKPNMKGFETKMKKANPTMGTGKAKFEFKEGQGYDDKEDEKLGMRRGRTSSKDLKGSHSTKEKSRRDDANFETKKEETKEASRTLGSGKYWGRKGLPKPKAAPRHIRVEGVNTKEVEILREKNEEYRKALNVFRNKLNEVAVFNSNLAYATRLFTEHSTSKQEKINILRRFDDVETIKESKNLYQIIRNELSSENVSKKPVNESIEKTLTKGSATNLIESKTYENPQFLRMKDLMSKLK